jgi:hypothetical protein
MPSECDEEENRRGEGSKPNYDSPDKRSLFFFFAVIAMKMPLHLNLQAGSPRHAQFNQNVSKSLGA